MANADERTEGDKGRVLVTGATGFIALHIISLLKKNGYIVRGTVRNAKNEAKVKPLTSLFTDSKNKLEMVEADLLSDGGWEKAAEDCDYCIHVASPFPNTPPKNENDVIRPAVDGTLRVLKACAESKSVKRVVLTSSISAVHGETVSDAKRIYDENDWSDLSSPHLDAYAKSKTMAEKAAWDFVEKLNAERDARNERKLELSVLNPSLVMGPSISGIVCTSLELMKRLFDGSMPLIPRLHLSMCDVRDVALAHLRAMTLPEAAFKRHIVASAHLWLTDMAHILRNEFASKGYFIPTWPAPNFCLYFYSFVDGSTKLILPRLERVYTFSNQRMKEVLGISAKSAEDTLIDTVEGLIECGVVKKTKSYKPRNPCN